MRKRVLAPIFKVRFHWRKPMKKLVSVALLRVSASVITKIRQRKHTFPLRKRYGNIQKVVRFRRIRSHGNMSKRHESAATETHVRRYVSATLSRVSAKFQSADSWHFVLCQVLSIQLNSIHFFFLSTQLLMQFSQLMVRQRSRRIYFQNGFFVPLTYHDP